jgi:hypothetical protein
MIFGVNINLDREDTAKVIDFMKERLRSAHEKEKTSTEHQQFLMNCLTFIKDIERGVEQLRLDI